LAAPAVVCRSDGNIFADDTPSWPAFTADLKGQVMSDKKHTHEASKAFRSSDKKAPLTEHEEKQKALLKNLERLKAERLAREAAKSKDD
jgi:predicted negative regulator of RcsB-dependent stress response